MGQRNRKLIFEQKTTIKDDDDDDDTDEKIKAHFIIDLDSLSMTV